MTMTEKIRYKVGPYDSFLSSNQLVVCTFYFYTEGMNYGDVSTSLTVHFSSGGHFHFHPGDFNLLPAEIHRQTRLYHSL